MSKNRNLSDISNVTGIIKSDTSGFSGAVAGSDYQSPITLTTTGTSGVASFSDGVLNIPNYGDSIGAAGSAGTSGSSGSTGSSGSSGTSGINGTSGSSGSSGSTGTSGSSGSTGSSGTSGAGTISNGTSGYVTKFTGSTTLGNSLIYDNGSGIGINTTSPGGVLDVRSANSGDALYRFWNTDTSGTGTSAIRIANSGNGNDGARIEFTDNSYYVATISGDRTQGIVFRTSSTGGSPTGITERMRITPGGNILIGSSGSDDNLGLHQLQLSGSARATQWRSYSNGQDVAYGGGFYQQSTSGTVYAIATLMGSAGQMRFWTYNPSDGFANHMNLTNGGNLLLGTATDGTSKLYVSTSSKVASYFYTTSTYAPIAWTGDGGTTKGGLIAHTGSVAIGPLNSGGTGVDGDKSLSINSTSGYVGIGGATTNVALNLKTPGNTQDGTFYSTFTINNTGSSTFSRVRFDRSGVAKWGLTLASNDTFRISNLYENGSATANDETFAIKNNNYVGIGTGDPSFKLHVKHTTGDDGTFTGGILVENSGTPAGEPALSFKNLETGSNYFITGLNQSNNYSIAYGTSFTDANTKFRVTAAGQILTWSNPAFLAYGNGNSTIDYNGTYLIYPNVQVNRGNHYNTSNGVFTAPVAGVYHFSWSSIGNNGNDVWRYWIRVNDITFLGDYHLRIDTGATGSEYGTNGNRSVIINLSANDTVRIYFRNDAGSAMYGINETSNSYHNFMGYLIG